MLLWPDYPGRDEFFASELIGDFNSVMKGVVTADFDNDGNLDFAVSYYTGHSSSKITIFYNNGDGSSFVQDDVYTHYPPDAKSSSIISDIDAADYNNDGMVDILYTYCECIEIFKVNSTGYVLFNDGTGHFNQKNFVFWHGMNETDPNPINPKMASADYDQDGDVDVIVGDNSGSLWFYKNDGNGVFSLFHRFQPGGEVSWGVAAADFDNDGDVDIAYSNTDEELEYRIHIRYNDGSSDCFIDACDVEITSSSFFLISFFTSPPPLSCCLTPIDYNSDGLMDLLCGQGNYYSLLIQQPDNSFEPFTAGRLPGRIQDALVGAMNAGDIYLLHNRFMLVDVIPPLDYGGLINDGIYSFGFFSTILGTMCYYPLAKGTTLVIGDLPVSVKPLQPLSKVEFYVDGKLKHTDDTEPFTWLYDTWSCGRHVIEVVGYDLEGNPGGADECIIWKF